MSSLQLPGHDFAFSVVLGIAAAGLMFASITGRKTPLLSALIESALYSLDWTAAWRHGSIRLAATTLAALLHREPRASLEVEEPMP